MRKMLSVKDIIALMELNPPVKGKTLVISFLDWVESCKHLGLVTKDDCFPNLAIWPSQLTSKFA